MTVHDRNISAPIDPIKLERLAEVAVKVGLQVMPFLEVEAPPTHSWPSASPTVRSVPGPE